MILTVDIGNTTIAFTGLKYTGNDYEVIFTKKIPSDINFSIGNCNPVFQVLEYVISNFRTIEGIVMSSVVPKLTQLISNAIEKIIGIQPKVISVESYNGIIKFAIPEPERLGLDRVADSAWVASHYKHKLPAVTVDIGTAMTFNVISKDSTFLGGMIAAGLQTSINALSDHAAQIPNINIVQPKKLIGINTTECMLSGAVIGSATMIDGIAYRVQKELGVPITLILTGGGADFVEPLCLFSHISEPYMLAKGLAMTINT